MSQEPKIGDKVIALTAVARTAAIVSGAASGAIAGWLVRHSLLAIVGSLFLGAVLGWLIGKIIGNIVFPAQNGTVMIAKGGPGSIPLTLKGNFIASLATALTISVLTILATGIGLETIAGLCVGTSVALGIVLALLVSLI
ncbi:hypothetical protein ACFL5H_04155 [Candidatus Latescibacterota bacterium]